jgi:hypothetical protein
MNTRLSVTINNFLYHWLKYHEPAQRPIDPPYKSALASKRAQDSNQDQELESKLSDFSIQSDD